jgi:hypothetical protein
MGSGIARQVKERVPSAYKAYMSHHNHKGISLGSVSYGTCCNGFCTVYNLNAQYQYGRGKRQLNYGALAESLMYIKDGLLDYGDVVGIPYKMGSDRAGGDWEIVLEMVEHILGKEHDIVIYKLED